MVFLPKQASINPLNNKIIRILLIFITVMNTFLIPVFMNKSHAAGVQITAPSQIVIGQSYTIQFSGSTSSTDWVALTETNGVYQQGQSPHWYYLSSGTRTAGTAAVDSGTITWTAEQTSQLTAGPKQIRFYPNDSTTATVTINVSAVSPQPTGPQISVENATIVQGQPLTVSFSGSTSPKDWIGVYDDQPGSRLWKYVNSDSQTAGTAVLTNGTLHFTGAETSILKLGTHTVRMLANDSSTDVMVSINVNVVAPTSNTVTFDSQGGSAEAPVTVISGNTITIPTAPNKDGFSFGGWYKDDLFTSPWNFGTDQVTGNLTLFAKWLSGTSSCCDKIELKIMTLNTAVGGQNSSPQAVAQSFLTAGADIIGIQEPFWSADVFKQVTGFYYNDRLGVLSRYPIIDNGQRDYIYVEVRPGEVVAVSNVQLPAAPYWPYQLRDKNVTPEQAMAGENNTRMLNMASRFQTLPTLAARNVPVFLTGDFNNPSSMDWTDSVKDSHFGDVVQWPVSQKLLSLGFHDSYRDIYPDPKVKPAYTWTPGTPIGTIDPNEVLDRIDFIYANGPAKTLDSKIVGETGPYTDLAIDPWVSDHRGVLSNFEVTPVSKSVLDQDPSPVHATLTPDKDTYRQGETIKIDYTESTRQFDIVAVYPENQAPTIQSKVFKYTAMDSDTLAGPIKPNGQVTFNSAALQPGTYKAYLLANRGFFALAETTFTVVKGPTITLDKTKIASGEPLTAAFTGSSSPSDWIGIVEQQESGRSVGDDFNDPNAKSDFSIHGAVKQNGELHATDLKFAVQPDGQYNNFAVTFDVNNYTAWGGWLGLAFGMSKPDSHYYDLGSNLFFFQNDQNARMIKYDVPGGTPLGWNTMGTTYQLDKKAENLNVKLVFENGKLDAYWKLQSEPESDLQVPKATWTGLNNNLGYMRFVVDGTGTPNFSIDNVMVYKDPYHLELDPKIPDGITAPQQIVIGQPYTIEYGGSTSKTDWVAMTDSNGVYQQGVAPHWYYLSNNDRTVPAELKESGIVTFTAQQTAQLSPGPMQIRFYPNGTQGAAKMIDVVAVQPDRNAMPWKYVNSSSRTPGSSIVQSGSVTFTAAETAVLDPGKIYTVRLMSADSQTNVLDSKTLTVGLPISRTVTYNTQGGSTIASVQAPYNSLLSEPAPPAKFGFAFGGWYTDAGLTKAWRFDTDKVTADITLYAKWNPDVDPPTAPTVTVSPAEWTTSDVSFSIVPGVDALSGVSKTQYRLNGGDWLDLSDNLPVISAEGVTVIEARSIDGVGNISELGKAFAQIDRTAPALSLSGLNDGAKVLMNSQMPISWTATDSGSGLKDGTSGIVQADTSSTGQHSVSVTVSDLAGNTTTKTITYTVYKFVGFLPPLQDGQAAKKGGVVPVKFQLENGTQYTGEAAATIQIGNVDGRAPGNSAGGNSFNYDEAAHDYHFNLSTKEVPSGMNTVTVTIKLGPSIIKKSFTIYVK